jgi:hypothetical protein
MVFDQPLHLRAVSRSFCGFRYGKEIRHPAKIAKSTARTAVLFASDYITKENLYQ